MIARARGGDWSVVLIGYQPVPRDWFPADLAGVSLLGLASGGGQQGPVLAAAGARVTVFDNSPRQLARDEEVAAREGLAIATVLGDMRDLSAFPDASFEIVFHPVSNLFCPDLAPVWREASRVLAPGGILMAGFMNPDLYIFDVGALERDEFVVRHPLPFSTLDLPDAERRQYYGDGPIEYSHSLTSQIGGQLAARLSLTHLAEAPHHGDATRRYMPGYIATRAVKGQGFRSPGSRVTGPSLTRLTFMSAPKTPVCTRAPSSPQGRDHRVHQRLGDRSGSRRLPGRAAALARVGVQRELADHQQRRGHVGAGLLAVQDPQPPELGGQLRRLLRGVVVGDADQDEQARLGDSADGLPVHRHAGLGHPLHHSSHEHVLLAVSGTRDSLGQVPGEPVTRLPAGGVEPLDVGVEMTARAG